MPWCPGCSARFRARSFRKVKRFRRGASPINDRALNEPLPLYISLILWRYRSSGELLEDSQVLQPGEHWTLRVIKDEPSFLTSVEMPDCRRLVGDARFYTHALRE